LRDKYLCENDDAYGYLNLVKDAAAGTLFWVLNAENDSSKPTSEFLGNGVVIGSAYTPWTNELVSRTEGSGGASTNLQNLSYAWDKTGNMHQRQDLIQNLTETFTPDALNRLTQVTLGSTTTMAVSYDAAGDILNKSDVGAYTYGDPHHPHAVTAAGSWAIGYDANGNMNTRAGGAITSYSYNLPNLINYGGNSSQFSYDSNHQRWKQVANYTGTTETVHYIGGLLEVMTRGSVTEYRHQIAAGSAGAVYTRRTDGSSSTYYMTSDHLGSADLVLDSAGNVLAKESFTAFGARRGSNWTGIPTTGDYTTFASTSRRGFTGQEMLDAVGLVHLNGRVYDPTIGRFLSADTVIQNLAASQSVNPYSYAWNNPLRYTDPSGHSLLGSILGILAAAIIIYFAPEFGPALFGDSWGLATAGIAGFVGGFVGAAVSTGNLSAALTAGLVGAITAMAFFEAGDFANNYFEGSNWQGTASVLAHAAVGCGSAMLSGGNCGRGALSAALSEAAEQSGAIKTAALASWGSVVGTAESGLVGGLSSEITGGKFNDGFTTAAAGYLFNSLLHVDKRVVTGDVTIQCYGATPEQCDEIVAQANASNIMFPDGSGVQITYRVWNPHFWEIFSTPDVVFEVQPLYGANGETYDGSNVLMIDPSRIDTNTVPHELGHWFGLDHNPSTGSVMYYQSVPQRPSTFDYSDTQQLLKTFGGKN
jgi:RHS repeat-associated protein